MTRLRLYDGREIDINHVGLRGLVRILLARIGRNR